MSVSPALMVRVAVGDFLTFLMEEPDALGVLHDGNRAAATEVVGLLTSHA
jgi:hypothetical protein